MRFAQTGTILGVAIAAVSGLSTAATAEIVDISATIGDGPANIVEQFFIPATNPQAHFGLDTLEVVEDVFGEGGPATHPGVAWFDLDVTVVRNVAPPGQPEWLAIDKDVINNTQFDWTDFHMEIGMRDQQGVFMPSVQGDGLFFKLNPPPVNKLPVLPVPSPVQPFDNPPDYIPHMDGMPPVPATDILWWDGGSQWPGQTTAYWLSMEIPANKFVPIGGGLEAANFVIRQHATSTPEPGTILGLLAVGGLGLGFKRKKQG